MYELQQEPIEQTILIVVFILKAIELLSSGKNLTRSPLMQFRILFNLFTNVIISTLKDVNILKG